MNKITTIQLFKNIRTLVQQSRQELYAVVNTALTETYFYVGRMIVEYKQHGSARAGYAKETLINLSVKLTAALGKGFSVDNLENMRKFYLIYKDEYSKHIDKKSISETMSRKLSLSPFNLSWSHYIFLTKIENNIERNFYNIEAATENWNYSFLKNKFLN